MSGYSYSDLSGFSHEELPNASELRSKRIQTMYEEISKEILSANSDNSNQLAIKKLNYNESALEEVLNILREKEYVIADNEFTGYITITW